MTSAQFIGPYRIESELGRGGMGEVVAAYDERLDRRVAIKRIRRDAANAKQRERLRREARAAAGLSHPSIVQVFDILSEGDDDAVVMELVDGRTLSDLLRVSGPLPLADVVRWGREIADGLAEAHHVGLVHRDLKAENVMVTTPRKHSDGGKDPGRVKILDFGLVKQVGDLRDPTLTRDGAILGTMRAMSPEQARGEEVDARSDLFSLGVLLYEMTTGCSPFLTDNAAKTLARIVAGTPRPVRELRPETPSGLAVLIGRLLAKAPAARPQDARAAARALAAVIEAGPLRTSTSEAETGGVDSFGEAPTGLWDFRDPSSAGPPEIRALWRGEPVVPAEFSERLEQQPLEQLFAPRLREVESALLDEHGGREIEARADSLTALFVRPIDATAFAQAWHQELTDLAARLDAPLTGRAAIHLTEVRLGSDGAVLPDPRFLADEDVVAQVTAMALPGQTLLTRGAFDLARRAAGDASETLQATGDVRPDGERWLAHGAYLPKGADTALEIFEIGVEGAAPLRAPPDSPAARRAEGDGILVGWRPAPGLCVPQRPNWRLERKLGEGGFGEVWLTRQTKTKEPRVFKFCYDAERLRALEREVTLFRLLKETLGERDDIARLLDWSFDEAPYFLEMEYTPEGSLREWAERRGGLAAVPRGARLELAAQAADALAAAHSVGVLHKDVKPANILVRGEDEPRVCLADFGVGGLLDRARLEEAEVTALGFSHSRLGEHLGEGDAAGTLLYAAPEVLEGRAASIQADVYSLGIVLYQLAIGDFSRILAPGWRRDLGDDLLAEDVAACVDGSPARRLTSASELARRLRGLEERRERRESERREALAAKETRRALEQTRRRRKASAILAAAAVLVAAVVSVFALQANRARRVAEENFDRSEKLVSFMLGDLQDTLKSVGRLDAMESTARRVLDHYASFDPASMTDEALQRRVRALHEIGLVQIQSGDPETARVVFGDAVRHAASLSERDPSDASRRALSADSHFWLGDVLSDLGDLDAAAKEFTRHRDLYAELDEAQPAHAPWRLELAYGESNLAYLLRLRGDFEGAMTHYQRRLEILQSLVAVSPDDRSLQEALAKSYRQTAKTHVRLGELKEALADYRVHLEIFRRLGDAAPEDAGLKNRLAIAESDIAWASIFLGDLDAALLHAKSERELFEELHALDSKNVEWRRSWAVARGRVGSILLGQGELERAEEELLAARETLRQAVAKNPKRVIWRRNLARQHLRLAELRLAQGRPGAARGDAERAAEILETLIAEPSADELTSLRLAEAYLIQARIFEQTKEAESEVLTLRRRALEMIDPDSKDPESLALRARAVLSLGNAADAEKEDARGLERF